MNKVGAIKKWCSKCGGELEANRYLKYRYCKTCHAAYMRENRPAYKDLSEDEKKKDIARSYIKEYIKRGYVKKMPCEKCGNEKSEPHHDDYSKPLQVRWLCREHHLDLHYPKRLINLK